MTPRQSGKSDAQTPLEIVDRMTVLATHLREVLSAESEVLKSQNLKKVSDFHEEKTRLANELALQISALKKAPHIVDRAPADRVSHLKSVMNALHEQSEQSSKLLAAAKSVSNGLVKAVAGLAAQKRAPQTGYGNSGAMAQTHHRGAPLSLDAMV
jgi:flagellar biosynthesis component FlhA